MNHQSQYRPVHPSSVSIMANINGTVTVAFNKGADTCTYKDATVALGAVQDWFDDGEDAFSKFMLAISRIRPTEEEPILDVAADVLDMISEAQRLLQRGWSEPDVMAWCKLSEGYCDFDEEKALTKKREIASRYS